MNAKHLLTRRTLFHIVNTRQYASRAGPGLWDKILSNLGLKEPPGKLIGTDQLGHKYYEREPWSGSRDPKTKRWVEREDSVDQWEQNYSKELDIPVEWRTWLQFKRNSPPTVEEIQKNIAMIKRTKHRAKELEERDRIEQGLSKEEMDKLESKQELLEFPVYPEFESKPITRRRDQ